MNLLIKSESLTLHLDLFNLEENKVIFLERRVSAFSALAEVFTHTTSKIMRDTLFAETHD